MSKRILILGGSHSDIPLILAAKELGLEVHLAGADESAPGVLLADYFHNADYSDKNIMLALAQNLSIDAITSGCNDFAAISSAYVAQEMQLPGHDAYKTSIMIHHKDEIYKVASEIELPIPNSEIIENGVEYSIAEGKALKILGLGPVVIKPINLTGGKGMSIVTRREELASALAFAGKSSPNSNLLVQQWMMGTNHGLLTLVNNGKVMLLVCDDEAYGTNKFQVKATSSPSLKVPRRLKKRITQCLQKLTDHLKLKDGVLHCQIILSEGKFYFLDICRRPPGDLYIKFAASTSGLDVPMLCIEPSLGIRRERLERILSRPSVRNCIYSNQFGVLKGISIQHRKGHLKELTPLRAVGHEIASMNDSKVAIEQLSFSSKRKMASYLRVATSVAEAAQSSKAIANELSVRAPKGINE